jgi:hypothetical protein
LSVIRLIFGTGKTHAGSTFGRTRIPPPLILPWTLLC